MTSAPTTSVISARSSSPSPPRFSSFHGKDWELRDVVAGYGCIDLFVEVASYCSWSELIFTLPTWLTFVCRRARAPSATPGPS